MSCVIELRGAANDLLHPVVQEGLAALRGALAAVERSLPRHVQKELEGFLGCGDPTNGFAWLHCAGCDHHRLVTFACKGRGFCPRCGGRRMAATAAWWIDRTPQASRRGRRERCERAERQARQAPQPAPGAERKARREGVIPHVATRQWVLTVPWKLRWLLARRPDLACGVHAVAMRTIERWYAKAAGVPKEGRTGSVTATQRFGSALNLNLHFHSIFLDGVYTRGADDRLSFRRVVPHTEDVERLVVRIADACEVWLTRQGFGPDEEGDAGEDDAQAVIQQASLLGQAALGERAGKRARRVQVLGGKEHTLPPRCASFAGYNLHAGVAFKASDRGGLERLCRYILRPPLSKDRLRRREDGTVEVGFKRVWSDGTAALVFTPLELVERLVSLVPPPRANQVIYRGVLAGNAAWRGEVVPTPKPESPDAAAARRAKRLTRHPRINLVDERPSWADLLERVFAVDAFACPGCGGRLLLRCVVLQPHAARRIVAGLQRATGPPSPSPAGEDRRA